MSKKHYIFLSIILVQVFCEDISKNQDEKILRNLTITAYLDDHRNIRLNITWINSLDKVDLMSIRFIDSDECNPIDGVDRYPVKETTSLILPPLTLVNPADYLINGCEYEVLIESEDLSPNLEQNLHYRIPDCVETKCKCDSRKNSPYQIQNITHLYDDVYFLKWNKLKNVNLTIVDIIYIRENNSKLLTHIKEKNLTEEGVEVLLPDLKEDINYRITIIFAYDGCYYSSSNVMSGPPNRITKRIVLELIFLLVFCAGILIVLFFFLPKFRSKIKRYIFCREFRTLEDDFSNTPLSFGTLKEELNPQYTPTDFLMNAYKYDECEIPRNKIIIKEEIGQGAFGVVYYGEAFEISNNQGWTKVAIKQLRCGASHEEQVDVLNEIKILKKVGSHKNIVKLLGCVTIDQPYMMVLEFVPCGSLKQYLQKLRVIWSQIKSRFLFSDDMLNIWRQSNEIMRQDSKNLKYAKVFFDNSDASYIQPDDMSITEALNELINKTNGKYLPSNGLRKISLKYPDPQSPVSITSSGLPSCAGTELTILSSEPPSPINIGDNLQAVLDHKELENFSLQIANGMEYLEQIKITHRDLAARNILMTNDKVLKISDFGLSRVGTYVSSVGQKLPLRWMAIEAIEEKTCDNKSDVWSFAVVLWEIGTLGAFPYRKTPNNLILHDLKIGKRLERPQVCSDELYSLMLKCWNEKPHDRPTFAEIVHQLQLVQKSAYVDFSKISPTYVFPEVKEEVEST